MDMYFPPQYKKALLNRKKNVTIRVGSERGKYKVGRVYNAKSYAGRDWGVKVKIVKVMKITKEELGDYIPLRSVKAIKSYGRVELIRFKFVN